MRDGFGVVRDGRFDVVGILPAFLLAVRMEEAFGSVQEAGSELCRYVVWA